MLEGFIFILGLAWYYTKLNQRNKNKMKSTIRYNMVNDIILQNGKVFQRWRNNTNTDIWHIKEIFLNGETGKYKFFGMADEGMTMEEMLLLAEVSQ